MGVPPSRDGVQPGCQVAELRPRGSWSSPRKPREQLELGDPQGTLQGYPREYGSGAGRSAPQPPSTALEPEGTRASLCPAEPRPAVTLRFLPPKSLTPPGARFPATHPCDPRLTDSETAPGATAACPAARRTFASRVDGGSSEAVDPKSGSAGGGAHQPGISTLCYHTQGGQLILTSQAPRTTLKHKGGRNQQLLQSSPLPQCDRGAGSPAAPAGGRDAMASRLASSSPTVPRHPEAAYGQTQPGLLGAAVKRVPERSLGFSCTHSPRIN